MIEIPKTFWKYYDLYRRNKITLLEFSSLACLSIADIQLFLEEITKDLG